MMEMDVINRIKLLRLVASHWRTISGLSQNSIGYIGWVGHNNLGDEAMIYSFKKLFSNYKIFPYSTIKNFPRLEDKLRPRKLQAVALGGGTLINSPGSFDTFNKAFDNYPDSIKFALGSGVKNPLFWNNVEGWQNNIANWIKLLEQCEYVSVRGPLSKKILADGGFERVEIIGDLALSLSGDRIIRKQKKKLLAINFGSGSGRIWGNEENLFDQIVELINQLIKEEWNITLFPVWEKDLKVITQVAQRINKPIKIFNGYKSISKTLKFLSGCDVLIGMKLHAVILAHCAYTPAIMLEYRPKCLDYMLSMDMEEFNIKTNHVEMNNVLSLLDEIYHNIQLYQNILKTKIDHYKDLQWNATRQLSRMF